jgi:hypothetical protein
MTWRLLPAIWESDLLPLDKLVLLCLSKYSDSNGRNAKPAQDTISRLTGIGPRRVRTALATLKKRGLIIAEGKGLKGTIAYRINLPLANNGDSVRADKVGLSMSQGRHRDSYNPIDNQLKNPSNLKDSKRDSYFDSDSGNAKRYQAKDSTRQPGETVSDSLDRLWREAKAKTRN